MKHDDPIFKEAQPLLTRQMPEVSKLSRTGMKYATKLFINRVEELQMKGLDCDPIQILMEIASGKVLNENGTVSVMMPPPEPAVRQKAAAELCSYIFPKRKAVEVSGDQDKPLQFVVMRDEDALPGAEGVVTLDGYQKNNLLAAVTADDEQDAIEEADSDSRPE